MTEWAQLQQVTKANAKAILDHYKVATWRDVDHVHSARMCVSSVRAACRDGRSVYCSRATVADVESVYEKVRAAWCFLPSYAAFFCILVRVISCCFVGAWVFIQSYVAVAVVVGGGGGGGADGGGCDCCDGGDVVVAAEEGGGSGGCGGGGGGGGGGGVAVAVAVMGGVGVGVGVVVVVVALRGGGDGRSLGRACAWHRPLCALASFSPGGSSSSGSARRGGRHQHFARRLLASRGRFVRHSDGSSELPDLKHSNTPCPEFIFFQLSKLLKI